MKAGALSLGLLMALLVVAVPAESVEAQLTPAHRKELSDLRRDLSKASSLVRRKDVEEAEKILADAESRLKKIADEAKLKDDDRAIAGYRKQIEIARDQIARQQGEKGGDAEPVSFVNDVAPILTRNCLNCHSDNPRGGLRLDTFAGMEAGGTNKPLLVVGQPARSLLTQKLTAQPPARMPRNGQPLAQKDIDTIAAWITQGAKFDGKDTDKTVSLRELGAAAKPKVEIAKATGNETVSFTKDIAPWMANLCLNCHGDRNPRSGFSLSTFEKLMQGGDSGRVVIPGNTDASRIHDLVVKQDPLKMPPGQALITRKNAQDLATWIQEGAKFDGNDAKAPLRSLVPSEEEMKAAELAKLTPEQWLEKRKERSEELWDRALTKDRPRWVEGQEFIVYGNVPEARLRDVNTWAEEFAKSLRQMFGEKETPIWKGKLAIFVIKDRFGYEEFNLVVNQRQVPREITAHSEVTSSYEDAYVVLQDVGDTSSAEFPGLHVGLIDQLTGAYLKRSGRKLPDWVLRGTGLAFAAKVAPEDAYIGGLKTTAPDMLKALDKPESIFADGTFSPAGVNSVGYTLVDFMLKSGPAKYGQFVRALQNGQTVAAAMQSTYQANLDAAARAYFMTLGKGR